MLQSLLTMSLSRECILLLAWWVQQYHYVGICVRTFCCLQLTVYGCWCRVISCSMQGLFGNILTTSTFGMISTNFVDFMGQNYLFHLCFFIVCSIMATLLLVLRPFSTFQCNIKISELPTFEMISSEFLDWHIRGQNQSFWDIFLVIRLHL